MKNFIKNLCMRDWVLPVVIWTCLSLMGSFQKSFPDITDRTNNCGKTYPIDYVIYTNLFCEVKP